MEVKMEFKMKSKRYIVYPVLLVTHMYILSPGIRLDGFFSYLHVGFRAEKSLSTQS